MSVSTDLQTVVARLSEAIAARAGYGRAELEALRRELGLIREDAARLQDGAFAAQRALQELADGVDAGRAELGKLSRRCRARGGASAPARVDEAA